MTGAGTENGLRISLPGKERRIHKRLLLIPVSGMVLGAALLLLIPTARHGAEALCNRLFDASEAVNRYAYTHFAAAPETDPGPAAAILGVMGLCWVGFVFACPSGGPAVLTALLLSAGQVYFGLSLPLWVLLPVYGLLAFRAGRELNRRNLLALAAVILALTAAVSALLPGVDEATEAASERVRDALGHPAAMSADSGGERPDRAFRETRHVNSQTLAEGGGAAVPDQSYRLVTVEEQQISMPQWIDWVKIALLLLLAVAVLILPFLPFAALGARRKKALEARAAFDAEDASTAVCAMFRHVMRYLDAAEGHASNALFSRRADELAAALPEDYRARCRACLPIFEEAAYSDHPIDENARGQVRSLLDETEALLYDRAGWRQRLKLRYGECLHL